MDFEMEPLESVRVKVGVTCGMSCNFCHQEGNHDAEDASVEEILEALEILQEDFGISEVHYTGGEPTLYPDLEELISKTKDRDFEVSMTSNGQYEPEKLQSVIDAGLDSVNFSIHHSLDPKAWLEMQGFDSTKPRQIRRGNRAMSRLTRNIEYAQDRIDTKVNTVVSDNPEHAKDVFMYCKTNDIPIRLLNDLTLGQEAIDNINDIIHEFDADVIGHEAEAVSSSHKFTYVTEDGYEFGVKAIRDFYLDSMCEGCEMKEDDCVERVYGIRLESNPLHARLCLHRDGEPYAQPFDDFVDSEQYEEIKDLNEHYDALLS